MRRPQTPAAASGSSDAARKALSRLLRTALVAVLCALTVSACSGVGDRVLVTPASPSSGEPSSTAPESSGPSGLATASGGWWGTTTLTPPSQTAGALPGSASSCPTWHAPGWVSAENALAGTGARVGTDGPGAVLGYLDQGATSCGGQVGLHLGVAPGSRSRAVTVAAYRVGWYGGAGDRLVWRSAPVKALPTTVPDGSALAHLVLPQWPATLPISIGPQWVPGFYLLVPQEVGGGLPAGPAIPLVVRDAGGREPILMVASTLTWNAYNDWGGWSLYRGPANNRDPSSPVTTADRAREVAVHRPLTGPGYSQLTFMDLPVVGELERLAVDRHLDVGYTTDVSVDADPGQLSAHAELVFGGHSEYWTTRMYDGLLVAQAGGVNAAFLGANNLWWRARLEGSTASGEPAREVVYRFAAQDPNRAEPTIQWQAVTPSRDPATVLGQSHAEIGVRGGLALVDPPAWFLAGSGLTAGQLLPGAVGNEADGYNPRARNPLRTQVLAQGVLDGRHGPVLTTISYSTQLSGAAVFAAGTTDWACGWTGVCADRTVPAATARAIGVLTANVLAALSTPSAGELYPASLAAPPTLAEAVRSLPAAAVGTYGGASTDEGPRLRAR